MSARPRKVGVDIDGVLVDTDGRAFLDFCKKKFGWEVDYEMYRKTNSWFDATKQNSAETIAEGFDQFIADVEGSQHPIDGAQDALKTIGEYAEIFLITARTGILQEVTEQFIREHLPDLQYSKLFMDSMERKVEHILRLNLDWYIDDSYREISLILQEPAVTTKLIPFPAFHGREKWNGIDDERVYWLSIWDKVTDELSMEHHPEIRQAAWQEIAGVIRN